MDLRRKITRYNVLDCWLRAPLTGAAGLALSAGQRSASFITSTSGYSWRDRLRRGLTAMNKGSFVVEHL